MGHFHEIFLLKIMEYEFKLQYFSCKVRYLHSVKCVDTPATGTSISASHVEMIPDPPITLNPNYAICSTFSTEMYQYIVDNGNAAWETILKKLF